jgi:hypothetical protein
MPRFLDWFDDPPANFKRFDTVASGRAEARMMSRRIKFRVVTALLAGINHVSIFDRETSAVVRRAPSRRSDASNGPETHQCVSFLR